VGIGFQGLRHVWLRAALVALGIAPILTPVAQAADSEASAADQPAADGATDQPVRLDGKLAEKFSDYRIEHVGKDRIKLVSTGLENSYAVTLLGSNSSAESAEAVLPAGEAWQRSFGVEVEGKLGAIFQTDLQTHFTQAQRTVDQELFGLQPLDTAGNNNRAVGEVSFTTQFLGDRISIGSTRKESSLEPFAELQTSKGISEQDQFSASIWRSAHTGLSVDGSLTRMDADYQDLIGNPGDILQKRNKETRQVRSKLDVYGVGLFVTQRDTSALSPDLPGAHPAQAEIETGISVGLSDLRDSGSGTLVAPVMAVLPDSIWLSTDHGSVEPATDNSSPAGALEKSAFGLTRNWDVAALNLSYWRSTVQTRPSLATDALWRAHGMDVTGNLYSGPWSVSGSLSWYRSDNLAEWNNSAEGSLNGSLFLAWHPQWGPKLSAGLTNYAYQADFFDYHGLEQSSLFRYQVAVDVSPWLASGLRDTQTQLTFLASFQGDATRYQWSQASYNGQEGNIFVGLKFARPFLY